MEKGINNEYFHWLCHFIKPTQFYNKLLHVLHDIEFTYSLPMDGNRADDGINLRYRFGYENDYPEPLIANELDVRPCSVLEMMVALVVRLEEQIMVNPDIGDRTGYWFWHMISNLHISGFTDDNFDEQIVRGAIEIFLDRKYAKNGDGGLFTVNKRKCDMRNVEIWYQMCWYITENERSNL